MRVVRLWLWTVFGLIFAMVVVGGVTRLTGSGLSMVEWHPLMGALPPMDEQAWHEVFTQYKRTPQYELVNHWMELADFKRIFFWEYVHRLLGRLLGLVFAVPWIAFIVKKRIRGGLLRHTAVALLLGAAQGLMGWVMVKSGLVDRPEVSHYRLAAHLALALLVGQWILWLLLNLRGGVQDVSTVSFRRTVLGTLSLLAVQVIYGAFMAGKRAGLMSSTFPDMNGHYGPGSFVTTFTSMLDSPIAIHWVHRTLAWFVLLAFTWLMWRARKETEVVRKIAAFALGVVVCQVALGALTVIYHVPTLVAALHQCTAVVLLSVTTWLAYRAGALPAHSYDTLPS